MSYKHNNLAAIRDCYWADQNSVQVALEKQFLQRLLQDLDIFSEPSLDDAKYLFFSLPSIIIVKGYALGFRHEKVKTLIMQYIEQNRAQLMQKDNVKIQYKM